ncbi:hypothetical protein [Arthrobacter sp. TMS2-4]
MTHFTADLADFRRRRTAILTVGGAQANVDLSTGTRAQTFLDSITRIYGKLGGFDGPDWTTYEGEQQPNTDQIIWVSRQLKSFYGQSFVITTPRAPWRPADKAHCKAMLEAGVLDMVSPQYYDGPGLAAEERGRPPRDDGCPLRTGSALSYGPILRYRRTISMLIFLGDSMTQQLEERSRASGPAGTDAHRVVG